MAENENADMGALEEQTEMALSEGLVRLPQFAVDKTDPSNYEEKPEATLQDVGQFALESLPVVGEAIAIKDTAEALQEGDYLGAGLNAAAGIVGIVPVVGDVAGKAIKRLNVDKASDADNAAKLLDDPDAMKAWREENRLPESKRQANPEDSKEAAAALREGEITSKEARNIIKESIPVPQEFTADQVRTMMPTLTEITGALGKKADRFPIIGVKGQDLEEGAKVSSRLDIPAYNDYDTWVVSIHDGEKASGSVVGFGQSIRLKNIEFGSNPEVALDIARGKRIVKATGEDAPKPFGKSTIARIFGEYQPEDPYALQEAAAKIIESGSDEWTQVGMNPYRSSAFYDKNTGTPVFRADEVIQVGPLVLAKNVKKPTISEMKRMGVRTRGGKPRIFNEGGLSMNEEQMMAALQSAAQSTGAAPDTTVGVDPVSGNDVPMGASPEEVRDDIPAQLSAGEYVVPADVVQYYGVKFFEDLRTSAKMGYDSMQQNGRVGGEPAEEMLPFDISELQVMEEPAPAMQMNVGGLTQRELHNLTGSTSLPNPFRVVTNDDGLSMTVRADEPVPEGFKRLDAEDYNDASRPEDVELDFSQMSIEEARDALDGMSAVSLGLSAGLGPLGSIAGFANVVGSALAADTFADRAANTSLSSAQRSALAGFSREVDPTGVLGAFSSDFGSAQEGTASEMGDVGAFSDPGGDQGSIDAPAPDSDFSPPDDGM